MRFLYTTVLYLSLPLIMGKLLWRSLRAPAYRKRWQERLGFFTLVPRSASAVAGPVIWVHAVSVGETLAAVPLIKSIQQQYPNARLVVTTTTPTGSDRVKAAFGDSVFHVYAPYDLPDAIARFLNRVRPELLIIMETELWPNILAACETRKIPVVLANARLSERSARGYEKAASLTHDMLQRLTAVASQTAADAERFRRLGLPAECSQVTGSIKFDLTLDDTLRSQASDLRQQWHAGERLVWLVASTHEGEDEIILEAFHQLLSSLPTLLLILVPRHPERFASVEKLCRSQEYQVQTRSSGAEVTRQTQILVGDTMGELLLFMGASDIAFIGGSLIPTGGHNLIEPAAWGIPIVSGPHLFNFAMVADLLQQAGALRITENAAQLEATVRQFADSAELRQKAGLAGKAVADANRGALARLLAIIDQQL